MRACVYLSSLLFNAKRYSLLVDNDRGISSDVCLLLCFRVVAVPEWDKRKTCG